ncbi:MAG TPA: hypothetical protein PKH81_01890 [Treponemataceae bacterium]|nr:hypothetical protein [Treponemataceae bacterium]
MDSNALDDFARFPGEGLIKSADEPLGGIQDDRKAALNRKGNELFNQGDVETARRIFVTTGYSDGLTRTGDWYAQKGKLLEALKMYYLAHNRRKADPIIEKLAKLISMTIS